MRLFMHGWLLNIHRFLITGMVFLVSGALVIGASGGTYYADASRLDDSGDGQSWATAKHTIQSAVDLAQSGDTVLVADGTYDEGGTLSDGYYVNANRVKLNSGVTLRSVNGPEFTFIKGNPASTAGTNYVEPVRCVYLESNAALIGFTLTNGMALRGSAGGCGGGAYGHAGSVLSNCVVSGNAAALGGGVYQGSLIDCVISGNTSSGSGGGCYESALVDCSVNGNTATNHGGGVYKGSMTDCTLMGNEAGNCGGGAYEAVLTRSTLTANSAMVDGGGASFGILSQCVLSSNTAVQYGGGASDAMLSDCTLIGNAARYGGGAGFNSGHGYAGTLTNCTLTGNRAVYGGGVYDCSLKNCTVSDNTAEQGGGFFAHECINSGLTLEGSVLSRNTATNGGGLYVESSAHDVEVNHCIIRDNYARECGAAYLSYWYLSSGPTSVRTATTVLRNTLITGNYGRVKDGGCYGGVYYNCTVAGNSAGGGAGGVNDASLYNCVVFMNMVEGGGLLDNYDAAHFEYSCTYPLPTNGSGNISSDPQLCGFFTSKQALRPGSPCVNAGLNAYVPTNASSVDLDGNERIMNGTVDMGAYESELSTFYVDASRPDDSGDGRSWAAAKRTIQSALEETKNGNTVLVAPGIYNEGGAVARLDESDSWGPAPVSMSRACVTNAVILRSVSGPAETVIEGAPGSNGSNDLDSVRAVYLGGGAVLDGFTIRNGYAASTNIYAHPTTSSDLRDQAGGGILGEYGETTATNCMITGNSALHGGGCAYVSLYNCTLSGNTAGFGGGAAWADMTDCMVISNTAINGGGAGGSCTLTRCLLVENEAEQGGGFYNEWFGILYYCTLSGNKARYGGGAYCGQLSHCLLTGNSAEIDGGGAYQATLNNCVVKNNTAVRGGGNHNSDLNNCTVAGNTAEVQGGGTYGGSAVNTIIWGNQCNTNSSGTNTTISSANYEGGTFETSCTEPLPSAGTGNMASDPLFVDLAGGNLALIGESPCINAGNNTNDVIPFYYAPSVTTNTPLCDYEENPRVVCGIVDMGAYEFQQVCTRCPRKYNEQYGQPLDGSHDNQDMDHDGHSNWEEWLAGTDPTNNQSQLRVTTEPQENGDGIVVRWNSKAGRLYNIYRCTNLNDSPAFTILQSDIPGVDGVIAYTDTEALDTPFRLYKIRVHMQ